MPQQQSPLFGAPTPPDPGGAFYASSKGASDNAALQVQAAANAAQLVVGALSSAMDMANRRDMQRRDIEASNKLATMREEAADARQRAADTAAMERAKLEQRGATQRARVQERGQNLRTFRSMQQNERQFGENMTFQREDAAARRSAADRDYQLRLAQDKREQEASLAMMRDHWDRHQQAEAIRFGKSFLPIAMSMAPYEPGLIPGTFQVKQGFPQSFASAAGGMQQAGAALGPVGGAGFREASRQMHQPGALQALLEQLQGFVQPGNAIATDAAQIQARGGSDGPGPVMSPPGAQYPVPPAVLEHLQKMTTGRDLSALNQLSGATIMYEPGDAPGSGRFSAPGQPETLVETLNRLAGSRMGTLAELERMTIAPDVMQSKWPGAARQQPAAPAPKPSAPRAAQQPAKPQAPSEPDSREFLQVKPPTAEQPNSEARRRSDESMARDFRDAYKARFDVGRSAERGAGSPGANAGQVQASTYPSRGAGEFEKSVAESRRRTGGGQNRGPSDTPLPRGEAPRRKPITEMRLSPKASEQALRVERRDQVERASEFLDRLKRSTAEFRKKANSPTELEQVIDWDARRRGASEELARLRASHGNDSLEATTFERIAKKWEYL